MLFLMLLLRNTMAEELIYLKWNVVNDNVMGGVSSSSIIETKNGLLFSGSVSKENNGGFASIRLQSALNLSTSKRLQIRATGDELQYQIVVWMGYGPRLYYKYNFKPSPDIQNILLSDFVPVSYGREVNAPPLELQRTNARTIGILIGDGQEGPFSLQIHQFSIVEEDHSNSSNIEEQQPDIEMVFTLQRAIQRGVPAYNEGKHQVCAEIYQTVLEDILFLKKSTLSQTQIQTIENVLKDALELPPDKKAWAYRYVIDALLREWL